VNVIQHKWALYWGAWFLMGVFLSTDDVLRFPSMKYLSHALPLNILQALGWGAMGTGVLGLAYAFPLVGSRWLIFRNTTIHLVGAVLLSLLGLILAFLLTTVFWDSQTRALATAKPLWAFRPFFNGYLHFNILLMWAVLGAYHSFKYYRQSIRQRLAASELESRLMQAQNQALRMQLQPHFLFNTLNSISALIRSEPEAADQMMVRLADLLRTTLDSAATQVVPLYQEMAFLEKYLAIELIRYSDRLRVRYEIDPEAMTAEVPAFILQPLVENAIKHGIAEVSGPSTLSIRAARKGTELLLEVEDTGRGFEGRHEGVGTRNTLERLRLLYQEQQSFVLTSSPGKGTVASVHIPWRLASQPA
jgi:two-component system, LytTR family, sensor kinase